MFSRKILVSEIIDTIYNNVNNEVLRIKTLTKEQIQSNEKDHVLSLDHKSSIFSYGYIEGINFVLELLTDVIDDEAMLYKEEKTKIENVEENIKETILNIEKNEKQ